MPRPMARAVGGSQSHSPIHETARNRPITVAIDASAGHSRSQKIVQRARLRARVRASPPARSRGGSVEGGAASAERSVKSNSSKENLSILARHQAPASGQKVGTSLMKTTSARYGSPASRRL